MEETSRKRQRGSAFDLAFEDFEQRLERRGRGDKQWANGMAPAMLVMLHLQMLESVFGEDAASNEAASVRKNWTKVLEMATTRFDVFRGREDVALDFFSWFASKQSRASKRKGHNLPGWRLVLGHEGLLDEYENTLRTKRRKLPAA